MNLYTFIQNYLEAKSREKEEVDYNSDKGLSIHREKGKKADLFVKQIDPKEDTVWNFCREVFGYKILGILRSKVTKTINLPKKKGYRIEIDEDVFEKTTRDGDGDVVDGLFKYSIVSSGSPAAITLASYYDDLADSLNKMREKLEDEKEPLLPFKKDLVELIENDAHKAYQITLINYIIPNVIIGNVDTHFGNFIKDPEKKIIYQIDPGRAFGTRGERGNSSTFLAMNKTFNIILTNLFSGDSFFKTGYSTPPHRATTFLGTDDEGSDPDFKRKFDAPRGGIHKFDYVREEFQELVLKNLKFWKDKLTPQLLQYMLTAIEAEEEKILARLEKLNTQLENKITEEREAELGSISWGIAKLLKKKQSSVIKFLSNSETLENIESRLYRDSSTEVKKKLKSLIIEYRDASAEYSMWDDGVWSTYRYDKGQFKSSFERIKTDLKKQFKEAQQTVERLLKKAS